MAHGAANSFTDGFTGTAVGQTFTLPVNIDPDFPTRAHVISVCTITGTVVGASLSYDVQMKDGVFIDSGQPPLSIAGTTGTVFRLTAIVSTGSVKGIRTRVNGWTGGTSASVVTTAVFLT